MQQKGKDVFVLVFFFQTKVNAVSWFVLERFKCLLAEQCIDLKYHIPENM